MKNKFVCNAKEFDDIKKKCPGFVKYVGDKVEEDTIVVCLVWVITIIIFVFFIRFLREFLPHLGIAYGIIGAYFLARGFLKSYKLIVCLSMARIGYSKPLANEYLKDRKNVAYGIMLVIFSLLIQGIVYSW